MLPVPRVHTKSEGPERIPTKSMQNTLIDVKALMVRYEQPDSSGFCMIIHRRKEQELDAESLKYF
jgi:hypothetical protein